MSDSPAGTPRSTSLAVVVEGGRAPHRGLRRSAGRSRRGAPGAAVTSAARSSSRRAPTRLPRRRLREEVPPDRVRGGPRRRSRGALFAPGATRSRAVLRGHLVVVARALFLPASTAVLVTWAARQDAPVGAAAAAHLGQPLIVVDPRVLPASVAAYLDAASGSLDAVAAFGRPAVPALVLVGAAVRLAAGRIAR